MPNIATNHAITYTNTLQLAIEVSFAVSLRLRTPFREVIPS